LQVLIGRLARFFLNDAQESGTDEPDGQPNHTQWASRYGAFYGLQRARFW